MTTAPDYTPTERALLRALADWPVMQDPPIVQDLARQLQQPWEAVDQGLRGLERRGLVAGVPAGVAVLRQWHLRAAGRAAVAEWEPGQCGACKAAAERTAGDFHPESDVGPWDAACPSCRHLGHHVAGCAVVADLGAAHA